MKVKAPRRRGRGTGEAEGNGPPGCLLGGTARRAGGGLTGGKHPRGACTRGVAGSPYRLSSWRDKASLEPNTEVWGPDHFPAGSRKRAPDLGGRRDTARPAPGWHPAPDTYSAAAASASDCAASILPSAELQPEPSEQLFPLWIHRQQRAGTGDWLLG